MLRVERRASAYADLEAIFDYIWQSSGTPRTAKAFVDRIDERCERLREVPLAGERATTSLSAYDSCPSRAR